jgi:hypothetical protein
MSSTNKQQEPRFDEIPIRSDLGEKKETKGPMEKVKEAAHGAKELIGIGDYAKSYEPENRYTGTSGPAQAPEYRVPGGEQPSDFPQINKNQESTWEQVKEKAGEVWEGAKEKATEVKEKVTEAKDKVAQQNPLPGFAQPKDNTTPATESTWVQVKEKAGELWDGAKEKVNEIFGKQPEETNTGNKPGFTDTENKGYDWQGQYGNRIEETTQNVTPEDRKTNDNPESTSYKSGWSNSDTKWTTTGGNKDPNPMEPATTGTVLSGDTSAFPGLDTNENSFPHSDRTLRTKQNEGN